MRFERRSFGRRPYPRANIPKPVKVGEEYDVDINEIGSKGDGIARVKNFVVFVNGVKRGEKAHIKITEVRNRFAIGEKMEEEKEEKTEEPKEEGSEVEIEKKEEEPKEEGSEVEKTEE